MIIGRIVYEPAYKQEWLRPQPADHLAQLQAAFLACTDAERAAFFRWLAGQAETRE